MLLRLAILSLLLVLPCENIIYSSEPHWTLRFCSQDNCEETLIELISSASRSIDCALYTLDRPGIINTIQNRASDLDVRIVMDSHAKSWFKNGTFVIKSNGSGLMHNKFCVVDKRTVLTGSWNPTKRSESDFNNIFVIESESIASKYAEEFEELWSGKFAKGMPTSRPAADYGTIVIETYFCPEDKCLSKLRKAVNSAQNEVYFMVYDFTASELAVDIILKHNAGVHIKGIMEGSKATSRQVFGMLKYQGIDVRMENSKGLLHHKVFIIDNETVVTGSFNPTANGNTRNDENMLIIHSREIAGMYLEEFGRIWDTTAQ